MRLLTFHVGSTTRAGRLSDDGTAVSELPYRDVGELLATGPRWRDVAEATGAVHGLSSLRLAPPVLAPPMIACVGVNYRAHLAELGRETPRFPTLFAKFATSLLGPNDDLVLSASSTQVDWEVELAVVIGRAARRCSPADAPEYIAGYTVANDVSMRDWQYRTNQFLQGKTFEASTPVGPVVVTADELPGGSPDDLRLTCRVDDVCYQDATTADMVFSAAEAVSYLSEITTLPPGSLILTGTPGGVGQAREPQVFLQPGQVMRSAVAGIGELVNRCVAEEHASHGRRDAVGEAAG